MKVSEYIKLLETAKKSYGDLECEDNYGEPIDGPEFNDDGGPAIFILADKA